MHVNAHAYLLAAALACGCLAPLTLWNRKRAQLTGPSRLRSTFVSTTGTLAAAAALAAFTKAFSNGSPYHAAAVIIVITTWVSVLNSAWPVPMPPWVLRVSEREVRLLQHSWTGVPLFGALLRHAPLRHLGGRVYRQCVGRDPLAVLPGIHAATAVHGWAVLATCPWFGFWATHGQWSSCLCGLAVHVPLNLYPLLHLRYVTGRLDRYRSRAHCRAAEQCKGS